MLMGIELYCGTEDGLPFSYAETNLNFLRVFLKQIHSV